MIAITCVIPVTFIFKIETGAGRQTRTSAAPCCDSTSAAQPSTLECLTNQTLAQQLSFSVAQAPKPRTGPIMGAELEVLQKRFKSLQNGSDVRGIAMAGGCIKRFSNRGMWRRAGVLGEMEHLTTSTVS